LVDTRAVIVDKALCTATQFRCCIDTHQMLFNITFTRVILKKRQKLTTTTTTKFRFTVVGVVGSSTIGLVVSELMPKDDVSSACNV
jgi:hypothetical protein